MPGYVTRRALLRWRPVRGGEARGDGAPTFLEYRIQTDIRLVLCYSVTIMLRWSLAPAFRSCHGISGEGAMMAFLCQDFLGLPSARTAKVRGGRAGLTRQVSWFHALESVEEVKFLQAE